MKNILCLFYFLIFVFPTFSQQTNFSQYVDPMIGTGGHGHTFPGATVPFGMVQLSPDTRIDGSWDGCSGYHHSDSVIYGFSHTHLSGTGCSDFGDIMLMPMLGEPSFDTKIYSSKFSHKNEIANAGFYKVKLDDDNIDVELTATTRVGFHKYTFNKSGQANIILDLTHRDKLLEGEIKVIDEKTIEVFRRSQAWATDQYIYARIEFSKVVKTINADKGDKASFSFDIKSGESILMKVALSTVSCEGAKKNMEAELQGWDFEKTKQAAEALWNKELSKIEITTDNKNKLKTFYTALYHTMIQPNVAMDVDGTYRGRDNKIHKADGFTYYSVFSLWDTFRAAHPLYTFIDQKRTTDFIKTFLAQYKDGGRLPVWELASNETDCMIGYHSVSVITDAAVKGITNFDMNLALEAMKKSATWNHLGLPAYIDHGCLAMEDEHESVSKCLEYAYDDWCIAQMAKLLNKPDDYETYINRSQYWKNMFDTETGFMRPRKNGGWLNPFEPRQVDNNYTEGNSWQYTFFVPQNVNGLISMMGGKSNFEKKLDELFTTSNKTTGREQPDITGLIGQYAHGNEPSHHMAYLYNYVGKSSKTQKYVQQIVNDFYKPLPDGLIGNEDCGQMSAWYVLSSMGFYEVCPGSGQFAIGSPAFKNVKIHLENNSDFILKTENFSTQNKYVQSISMNNQKWLKNYFDYFDIKNGNTLLFKMTDKPNDWEEIAIASTIGFEPGAGLIPSPVIKLTSKTFKEKLNLELKNNSGNYTIYYTTDNSEPTKKSTPYTTPIYITQTTTIKTIAINETGKQSFVTSGTFYKMPHPDWKIKINSTYNPQYTAGGDEGIIDGIRGDADWRKGEWQGYQSQDFECVIELGKQENISFVSAGFLQDTRSWILMPTKVEYFSSSDNISFTLISTIYNTIKDSDMNSQIKDFSEKLSNPVTAKFIKIKATNYGKLPSWHQGAGGDAFIFIDELIIK